MAARSLSAPVALAVGAAVLLGCPSKTPPPEPEAVDAQAQQEARAPSCDTDKLDAAASTLASNKRGWSPARGVLPAFSEYVAAILWNNCDLPLGYRMLVASRVDVPSEGGRALVEKALPGYSKVIFNDEALGALGEAQAAVCPKRGELASHIATLPGAERPAATFDGCDLADGPLPREAFIAARLGFDGVGAVALHGWLRKAGVAEATADSLIRTLILDGLPLVGTLSFRPPESLRLPAVAAPSRPRASALVYVSPEAVVFHDHVVVNLEPGADARALVAGMGLAPLVDELSAVEPQGVSFAIDRNTSWEVAALILATAGRAGATWIDVLVLGPDPDDALRSVTMLQRFDGDAALVVNVDGATIIARCADVHDVSLDEALEACSVADDAPVEVQIGRRTSLVQVLEALVPLGERPRALRTVTG